MGIHTSIAHLRDYFLRASEHVWNEKGKFFVVFFCVMLISYGVLFFVDFIPEAPTEIQQVAVVHTDVSPESTEEREEVAPVVAAYPTRVAIEQIDLDTPVLNPDSREIADLDAALLKGAVRHPDSADFMQKGTMVIFGHSSYLPVVHNKNFQAFNGIQKLVWGDKIHVFSEDMEYIYRVDKEYKAQASEDSLTLDHSKERLVLVTCNSFGSKDDRFVVEATLVEKRAL